jgi:hypothetical protein
MPRIATIGVYGFDEHHPELAPTTELRQLQYREDDRRGIGKRSRRELAPEYARRYIAEILTAPTSPRSFRRHLLWLRVLHAGLLSHKRSAFGCVLDAGGC